MARAAKPQRVKLIFRHSSPLLKCIVLAALVLSIVALLTLRSAIHRTQNQAETLRQEAAALKEENKNLEQSIAGLGTLESIKQIAMEKLGLVEPGSWFFSPVE